MALKFATGFNSVLVYPITEASTYVEVSVTDASNVANYLTDPSDFLFLEVINSLGTYQPVSEIIKVTSVLIAGATGRLVCERAQEGTTALSFPAGCFVRHVLAPSAITSFQPITIEATGLTVNGGSSAVLAPGGTATLAAPVPTITGAGGATVTGVWPNLEVSAAAVEIVAGFGLTSNKIQTGGTTEYEITETPRWMANYSFCGATVNADATAPITPATFTPNGTIEGLALDTAGNVIGVKTRTFPNGTYSRSTITVSDGRITSIEQGAPSDFSVLGASGRTVVTAPLADAWQVDLAPSGVNPGSYGPFQIDQFGRVTAATGGTFVTQVQGSGAIQVSTVGSTASVSVAVGSEVQYGVVQLATKADTMDSIGTGAVQAQFLRDAVEAMGGVAGPPVTAGALAGPANAHVIATATPPPDTQHALIIGQTYNPTPHSVSIYVGGVLQVSIPSNSDNCKTVIAYVSSAALVELRSTEATTTGLLTIVPFR